MTREYLFTSESVSEGHPDKVADQISDAVVDYLLGLDPQAKVACETLIAKDFLAIAGEFRSSVPDLIATLQGAVPGLARGVLTGIGYTAASGFDPHHHNLRMALNGQSDHIHQGVERGGGVLGAGDTGVTGRKIIVDTYGGSCPHGGGAFSGKDPSKVDRSAAYAARWVAKHLVAAGAAKRCTIQVAYAIGVAEPVSLLLDFHGTGTLPETVAEEIVKQLFDLRPAAILEALDLRRPRYRPTAAYGHFGRETEGFSWERTGRIEELRILMSESQVRQ